MNEESLTFITRVPESDKTLRDWFAGLSLAALIESGWVERRTVPLAVSVNDVLAAQSYFIADAMMDARAREQKK